MQTMTSIGTRRRMDSLLSGDSEGLSASTGGLGSLSSNSDTPVMSETSMVLGLSHSLEILSHESVNVVGNDLVPSSFLWIFLSVQEPLWDVVLKGSGEEILDLSDLFFVDLTGSLVGVDLADFHGQNGESSTDTSDLSKTEWSLLFTVDVCVLNSKNVLEFVRVLQYQRSHISLLRTRSFIK